MEASLAKHLTKMITRRVVETEEQSSNSKKKKKKKKKKNKNKKKKRNGVSATSAESMLPATLEQRHVDEDDDEEESEDAETPVAVATTRRADTAAVASLVSPNKPLPSASIRVSPPTKISDSASPPDESSPFSVPPPRPRATSVGVASSEEAVMVAGLAPREVASRNSGSPNIQIRKKNKPKKSKGAGGQADSLNRRKSVESLTPFVITEPPSFRVASKSSEVSVATSPRSSEDESDDRSPSPAAPAAVVAAPPMPLPPRYKRFVFLQKRKIFKQSF